MEKPYCRCKTHWSIKVLLFNYIFDKKTKKKFDYVQSQHILWPIVTYATLFETKIHFRKENDWQRKKTVAILLHILYNRCSWLLVIKKRRDFSALNDFRTIEILKQMFSKYILRPQGVLIYIWHISEDLIKFLYKNSVFYCYYFSYLLWSHLCSITKLEEYQWVKKKKGMETGMHSWKTKANADWCKQSIT